MIGEMISDGVYRATGGTVKVGEDYVSIATESGEEIAYWQEAEWVEDPQVLFAILNAVVMALSQGVPKVAETVGITVGKYAQESRVRDELTKPDLRMECTCSYAPTQYEGTVNGKPLYYRSRWGHWRLVVAESLDKAITAQSGDEGVLFYREGPDGGDPESAEAIIQKCARQYVMGLPK